MSLLAQLFMQLPVFLVAIIGFVLAGIFMQRARKSAILVVIASIITLLQSALSIFNQMVLLDLMIDGVISETAYGVIVSGGFTLFYLAISGLLLAAVFTGRNGGSINQQTTTTSTEAVAPASTQISHRGELVLTLGLLGLLLFAPLGIAAWILGNKDLASMREGIMDNSGEGMTLAGKVLGILASVLMVIGILLLFGAIVVVAGSDWRF